VASSSSTLRSSSSDGGSTAHAVASSEEPQDETDKRRGAGGRPSNDERDRQSVEQARLLRAVTVMGSAVANVHGTDLRPLVRL
jgi:hypothetical protein